MPPTSDQLGSFPFDTTMHTAPKCVRNIGRDVNNRVDSSSKKHAFFGDFSQRTNLEKASARTDHMQRSASHVHFTDSKTTVMDLVAYNKAWKSFQEKIQQLEVERKQAERHMKHLYNECVQYTKPSDQETEKKDIARINNEAVNCPCVHVSASAGNCSLLQIQLEYMIDELKNGDTEINRALEKESMEFTFKRGYVGSPLHSLENIPQTSLDVQQKPVPPHVTITGSRNRDKADVISHAANGKAIVSALKNLQEKIRCLEVERTEAEKKMQNLTYESVKFKNTVEQEEKNSTNIKTGVSNELSVQLSTVEGRCSLLEKQLEYMRTMVDHTQTEKSILLQKQASLQMDRQWNPAELQSKLEKLEILEQECLKVNATQTRAESKINELEQKLQEEEHQRKLIQDKAAQLQTGLELNRILIGSCSVKKKKKTKKKKDTVKNEMREKSSWSPRVRTGLAEFPFVAGTSISTSHSVTANIQNVFHLMKHYNTMMSDGRQKLPVQRTPQNSRKTTYDSGKVKNGDLHFVSPYSSASSPTEGLTEILLALQDELGQMSFEHQDLLKQIQGTKNTDVREDLERELDCLVKRMEKKADQISKLRKHQDKVEKLKVKAKKMTREMADAKKRAKALDEMKEVPANPRGTEFSVKTTSAPGQKGKESLQLLRNAQKLQLTLRQNDITWEQ
ncbi:centrosomal protein CEP57L1 isoform X2 [Scyliorhinus torazame]|uniref:centrosomal protein CEP57L1 isoform X2 n=1 Tax=Scyliorhinus torazame TaxID=75743 RepID=UPI003B5A52B2